MSEYELAMAPETGSGGDPASLSARNLSIGQGWLRPRAARSGDGARRLAKTAYDMSVGAETGSNKSFEAEFHEDPWNLKR